MYILIGECLELWCDPMAWRVRLLDGAVQMTDSMAGTVQRFAPGSHENAPSVTLIAATRWPDNRLFDSFKQSLEDGAPLPAFERVLARLRARGSVTMARTEILSDDEWYRTSYFNDYVIPAQADHFILSLRVIEPVTYGLEAITVGRALNDPAYSLRETRVMRLLHEALAPLVRTRLATESDRSLIGLPQRCRGTLVKLLEGASEKEIARSTSRSINTIHEHVKVIYQHFDVASRAELLAYFVQRRPKPIDSVPPHQNGITSRPR